MALIKYLLLLILFISSSAWSQGFVTEIDTANKLNADGITPEMFNQGDRVVIASKNEKKILGFGKIIYMAPNLESFPAQIEIEEIIDNSLIGIGDIVFPLDMEVLKELKVPGFVSLTLSGDSHIPAKYKELAYFGVFTSEGHTLDRYESLVSPFQAQYGLTDKISIKVVTALFLDGYANTGFKYQAAKNKYLKFTPNTFVGYKLDGRTDWIWQIGGVISTPQNAKFQNHLMFNFTMEKQSVISKATEGLNLYQDSDIRSITEYATDNWNRILFGPTYNVELQTFGGTVSYMYIWNSFHLSLGLATKDFTELKFGKEGYYYVYDFFWRF